MNQMIKMMIISALGLLFIVFLMANENSTKSISIPETSSMESSPKAAPAISPMDLIQTPLDLPPVDATPTFAKTEYDPAFILHCIGAGNGTDECNDVTQKLSEDDTILDEMIKNMSPRARKAFMNEYYDVIEQTKTINNVSRRAKTTAETISEANELMQEVQSQQSE